MDCPVTCSGSGPERDVPNFVHGADRPRARHQECEDCLKTGDSWIYLGLCLVCGHVGCVDSSKNKHATKHFHTSNHPIIQSFEPGEDWRWCYVDQAFM